ncbi:MAG: hypothetical protein HDT37_05205 [Clostridiales bacterium]|nr:hypothetical protein [Clostridiales bacterium]
MPNKIKDIFSDDMFDMGGNIRFRDHEAYKNFLAALEIVHTEGRTVPVEGVIAVSTKVSHEGTTFPLGDHDNISKFVVGPAVEPVAIPLNVRGDEKVITLWRSQVKDKVILRSEPDSIVSFRFTFLLSEHKLNINYIVQFEKAKSIEDLADSFGLAEALLTFFCKHENGKPSEEDAASLSNIKKYFRYYEAFFQRLQMVENELDLSVSPSLLKKLSREEQQDIDELYLLLCKKRVLRLNAQLTATDSTTIDMDHSNSTLNIGSKISLTFLSTIEFNFLEQTVLLHTANLIVNALVKDVQKSDDGTVKILYGDTDSKPMYIAFSAFKTEEEAEHEMSDIMEHNEMYINALISNVYIKQFYSEKD